MTKKPKAKKEDSVRIGVVYDNARTTPNTIRLYFHCRRCLEEFKAGIDHLGEPIPPMRPADYCRLNVGITTGDGWQVWCVRHEVNVTEFHIEDATAEALSGDPRK